MCVRGTKTTDLVEFSRDTLDPERSRERGVAAIYAAEAYRVASRPNPARSQFSSALADNPDESAEAWAHYGELLEDAGLVRGASTVLQGHEPRPVTEGVDARIPVVHRR